MANPASCCSILHSSTFSTVVDNLGSRVLPSGRVALLRVEKSVNNSCRAVLGSKVGSSVPRRHRKILRLERFAKGALETEIVRDEEWEERMRSETRERDEERQRAKDDGQLTERAYKSIVDKLRSYPPEDVKNARIFVADLIRSGEGVEQMIEEAGENGELTPLVLLIIENRLELAHHDKETHAIQALDLLRRRVETEMFSREASPAMRLLNTLLHLNDGFNREEWLKQCRRTMLQVFPPEDAFSILGGPGFDLYNHDGPIGMPEDDDDLLLRADFIREVSALLTELKAHPLPYPEQGLDPESVAMRLRQEERVRALKQVKDLLALAVKLKW